MGLYSNDITKSELDLKTLTYTGENPIEKENNTKTSKEITMEE